MQKVILTLTALACVAHGQRVWYLCSGDQFRAPTPEEEANEVQSANGMTCTPEYTFQQLCCLDYPNIMTQMTRTGVMELAAAQHSDPQGHVLMQDDATQANLKILTLCGAGSPVGTVAQGAGGSAILPAECVKRMFTVPEITTELNGVKPGTLVLNERIQYLMDQQLPPSAIPICTEEVSMCPATVGMPNGYPPASAGPEYLAKRQQGMQGGSSPSQPQPQQPQVMQPQGMQPQQPQQQLGMSLSKVPGPTAEVGSIESPRMALLRRHDNDFGGSLMTSGSFTMVSGGGF